MQPTTPLAPIANKESFIERFGDWIEGLFHKSEDLYNSLTEAEKKAAVWGSGLISVANTYIDVAPDQLWAIIQEKFPDLSENVVHGFIDELRDKVDNTQSKIPLTLVDALAWLQTYLKQYHGDHEILNAISTNAYNILTILLSPETAIEKIIGIGVYVYHLIVKPHVESGTTVNTTPTPLPDPAPSPAIPPPTGTTETAQTPDKDGAAVSLGNAPAQPAATDPDMQISNEAAANLGAPQADESHDPIEEAAKANRAPTDFELKNGGASAADVPAPTADQQAANDAPNTEAAKPGMEVGPDSGESGQFSGNPEGAPAAPLTPGTPEFESAVEAEVQKRLANSNG